MLPNISAVEAISKRYDYIGRFLLADMRPAPGLIKVDVGEDIILPHAMR
jgi:hypothetical protein